MTYPDSWISEVYPSEIVQWFSVLADASERGTSHSTQRRRLLAIIRTPEVSDGFARALERILIDDAKARKDCIQGFQRFAEAAAALPDQAPFDSIRRVDNDQDGSAEDTPEETERRIAKILEDIVDLKYAYEEMKSNSIVRVGNEQDSLPSERSGIRQRWMFDKIETLATTNLNTWDRDRVVPAVLRVVLSEGAEYSEGKAA